MRAENELELAPSWRGVQGVGVFTGHNDGAVSKGVSATLPEVLPEVTHHRPTLLLPKDTPTLRKGTKVQDLKLSPSPQFGNPVSTLDTGVTMDVQPKEKPMEDLGIVVTVAVLFWSLLSELTPRLRR